MIRLKPLKFTCPFCNKEKITFITDEKLEEVVERSRHIRDIFPEQFFAKTYREIFISHICSDCQDSVFDDKNTHIYDVDENQDSSELEALIIDMYENAFE